ncbi:MAG: pyrroline-5-carboxylate reductase [Pseudomonadota bacterium]|nr:pyrroline-5-carboxylate reductase [Pseudomonadota bacterium]
MASISVLDNTRIAFIGAGNMASALIQGLLSKGLKAARLQVSDKDQQRLSYFEEQLHIKTSTDNLQICEQADVIVLAVKPQTLPAVLSEIAPTLKGKQPLVISIAAGTTSSAIAEILGESAAIVRAMPNTPAMVQTGATGLYANAHVNDAQKQIADALLSAVGLVTWVQDEALINAITAVSGSGPAYFFYLMEAMINAGLALGLDATTARDLTLQTALGAAQLAITSDESPSTLREKVTSPGGTTAAALQALNDQGVSEAVIKALTAARDRSQELSQ